ncbi:ThuA domain-containing protein [Conexibacter sp. JD483]|uniref:ThuA domain-containing protein n=1 Tax=unclassified Conexibacter TaxID=2627773 RepID=UPI0027233303|nr:MULTISPECIES: ThuA domain-containing protein [unclassified Conexibacter]MDO8187343.1 ThuA domain-containing protein [Conexibacter sp. CPCC 205706]MDO8200524.1 ThuA domain-containing protein [Conexibacter sp. CPCC 205762]MDR9370007.1 ThuA domain-containing protein [Conexibacter sp. JD483]
MSRSALIVWGGWPGHKPQEGAEKVAALLEAEGIEATLADDVAVFEDFERLRQYDLISAQWALGSLTRTQEVNLREAVRAGSGLGAWHGSADSFRSSVVYQYVLGSQFVAEPGGFTPYRVEVDVPGDPIVAGVEAFEFTSELYYLHVDPAVRVLASTTIDAELVPWAAGAKIPVVYTKGFGAGRVFYCSLGHDPADLDHPSVAQFIRRGFAWAARA